MFPWYLIIFLKRSLVFPILLFSSIFFALITEEGFRISPCSSVQVSSVAQSCSILCNPMNRRTPGLPVHHQLLEFTQTHVHQVGDAIQPSHPLSSPSPPAPNPSQHQGLFQWVNSSHEVAKFSLLLEVLIFCFSHSPFLKFFSSCSCTCLEVVTPLSYYVCKWEVKKNSHLFIRT